MKAKLLRAYRLLRQEGIAAFSVIAYRNLKLKADIFVRGRNKVVSLDGCRYDLRKLPNTLMKLKLLTGSYELPERVAARRYIRPEWAVVELGGCIGVVACITNKLLQSPERHIVLEANPLVIPHLEANRRVNGSSFTILNRALAYDREAVTFTPLEDFWGTSLYKNEGHVVTVPTTQLSTILSENHFEDFALICDIEGEELELVFRETKAVSKARLIIMEVHPDVIGKERVSLLLAKLLDSGFQMVEQSASVMVLSRDSLTSGGPNLRSSSTSSAVATLAD